MGEQFNVAEWLVDRHVAEGRGDRVAIRCEGRSMTYAALQRDIWRVQHLLAALGLDTGDRIAMVVQDDETFPAFFLGGQRSGLVPVPLSTMLKGHSLGEIVADSGARALIISDTFLDSVDAITAAAPSIESVIVSGESNVKIDDETTVRWSPWSEGEGDPVDPAPLADTTAATPSFWLYSSGTTGMPKGVMHRHGNVKATVDTYATTTLRITEDDRCLSVAKLFFAYGLGNSLTFPLAVGATAVLNPAPPTPALMADLIAQEQPTLFFSSPGFCAALLDTATDPSIFDSVRATVTAGESLPANIQTRFAELAGCPVLDGIGSTELLHIFLSNTLDAQVPGSSGWIVDGYEAQLRDDDDNVVEEPDTPGYLHVRGDSAATGYWERPDATAAAFRDGWVRTGDVYTRGADDSWTFLGRNNDMIKAGGIWVSPAEVESVLIEHPTVREAAVVGSRDDDGLEVAVAFVIAAAGSTIDADELDTHCRERMATFKRPRQLHVVDDFPRTATGKIKRFELRDSLDGA